MAKDKYERPLFILFTLNVIFLIWAILWKCGVPSIGNETQRAINILPFNGNTRWEMQFNILLFVPFGFYLSAAMPKSKIVKLFLFTALASVILEIAQYILAVGRSDITDVLLNTVGGGIGIAAFYTLSKLFDKHSRKAVMFVCILIIAFELYMSTSFILFGQVRLGHVIFRL